MKEIPVHNYTMKELPVLKKHVHDVMEEGLLHYRKYKTSKVELN